MDDVCEDCGKGIKTYLPEFDSMTIDTPRTDEQQNDFAYELCDVVDAEFAQQLERELNASKAEVKSLEEQLDSTKRLALKFWKVLEENGFKIELPLPK